jgi:hypothetical protein
VGLALKTKMWSPLPSRRALPGNSSCLCTRTCVSFLKTQPAGGVTRVRAATALFWRAAEAPSCVQPAQRAQHVTLISLQRHDVADAGVAHPGAQIQGTHFRLTCLACIADPNVVACCCFLAPQGAAHVSKLAGSPLPLSRLVRAASLASPRGTPRTPRTASPSPRLNSAVGFLPYGRNILDATTPVEQDEDEEGELNAAVKATPPSTPLLHAGTPMNATAAAQRSEQEPFTPFSVFVALCLDHMAREPTNPAFQPLPRADTGAAAPSQQVPGQLEVHPTPLVLALSLWDQLQAWQKVSRVLLVCVSNSKPSANTIPVATNVSAPIAWHRRYSTARCIRCAWI